MILSSPDVHIVGAFFFMAGVSPDAFERPANALLIVYAVDDRVKLAAIDHPVRAIGEAEL
jgi:hypothetical protein